VPKEAIRYGLACSGTGSYLPMQAGPSGPQIGVRSVKSRASIPRLPSFHVAICVSTARKLLGCSVRLSGAGHSRSKVSPPVSYQYLKVLMS
jgi:hypothetical protein